MQACFISGHFGITLLGHGGFSSKGSRGQETWQDWREPCQFHPPETAFITGASGTISVS
jgi:hypothetical protein